MRNRENLTMGSGPSSAHIGGAAPNRKAFYPATRTTVTGKSGNEGMKKGKRDAFQGSVSRLGRSRSLKIAFGWLRQRHASRMIGPSRADNRSPRKKRTAERGASHFLRH